MENKMRLINANELLELYYMGEELEGYAGVLSVPILVIRQNIKDMTTIDAVPVVHGYWKPIASGEDLYECSICSEWQYITNKMFNYCPNCCAIMDGGN